jgi:hypothetical protein
MNCPDGLLRSSDWLRRRTKRSSFALCLAWGLGFAPAVPMRDNGNGTVEICCGWSRATGVGSQRSSGFLLRAARCLC